MLPRAAWRHVLRSCAVSRRLAEGKLGTDSVGSKGELRCGANPSNPPQADSQDELRCSAIQKFKNEVNGCPVPRCGTGRYNGNVNVPSRSGRYEVKGRELGWRGEMASGEKRRANCCSRR